MIAGRSVYVPQQQGGDLVVEWGCSDTGRCRVDLLKGSGEMHWRAGKLAFFCPICRVRV